MIPNRTQDRPGKFGNSSKPVPIFCQKCGRAINIKQTQKLTAHICNTCKRK